MLIGRFPLSPPSERLGASPWRRGRAGTPGLGPEGCSQQRQRCGEEEGREREGRQKLVERGRGQPTETRGERRPGAGVPRPSRVAGSGGAGTASPGQGTPSRALQASPAVQHSRS